MSEAQLITPSLARLPAYVAALARGWSPDNTQPEEVRREQLAAIAADATGFLARLDDRMARGKPLRLPDGSEIPRLPGIRRWIWKARRASAARSASAGSPGPPRCRPMCWAISAMPWCPGSGAGAMRNAPSR